MAELGTILYCAGARWFGVKGTDHHVALELARSNPVLWVDPPVPITRRRAALGERSGLRPCIREVMGGVRVLQTAGPPWPHRPLAWRATSTVTDMVIRAAQRRMTVPVSTVIVSSPQPRLRIPSAVYVYYATDDYAAGAPLMGVSRARLEHWEQEQLKRADLRVAVSTRLAQRWGASGLAAVVLPNGCDPALAARVAALRPAPEVSLSQPVAGVVGHLTQRIDVALLEAVADAMSLLLIGPMADSFRRGMNKLLARPNVQWVGRQSYDALPAFLRAIDVGLTPYSHSQFNSVSVPLKTFEYLAAGLPVVSTTNVGGQQLPRPLVHYADTPAQFASLARAAVGLRHMSGFRQQREEFVTANSWARRVADLSDAIRAVAR